VSRLARLQPALACCAQWVVWDSGSLPRATAITGMLPFINLREMNLTQLQVPLLLNYFNIFSFAGWTLRETLD
jgi:hypothetical protein